MEPRKIACRVLLEDESIVHACICRRYFIGCTYGNNIRGLLCFILKRFVPLVPLLITLVCLLLISTAERLDIIAMDPTPMAACTAGDSSVYTTPDRRSSVEKARSKDCASCGHRWGFNSSTPPPVSTTSAISLKCGRAFSTEDLRSDYCNTLQVLCAAVAFGTSSWLAPVKLFNYSRGRALRASPKKHEHRRTAHNPAVEPE